MIDIVLEGPDGGGKSTLARQIAEVINWNVQPSEGPDKYPGEQNDRVSRYLGMPPTIFDRHPAISQNIYCEIRGGHNPVAGGLVAAFYYRQPVCIYCRVDNAEEAMKRHVVKEHDTPAHLEKIQKFYGVLIESYDRWALRKANVIYRIGDNADAIIMYLQRRVLGC